MLRVLGFTVVSVLFVSAASLHAQVSYSRMFGKVPRIICYASDEPSDLHIPPPEAYLSRLKSGQEAGASFGFELISAPDDQALTTAEEAGRIWASLVCSPVPIVVRVEFSDLSEPLSNGPLASTSIDNFYLADANGHLPPGWYPTALYEKLTERNRNGNLPDMTIRFNTKFNWYFGTDGEPVEQHDFLSTLLHEMAHGMGFIGALGVNEHGLGSTAVPPVVFDGFVQNIDGKTLSDTTDFPNYSTELAEALVTSPVYFRSPLAKANLNEVPRLYVPPTFNPGSSIYHLDDIYNFGPNALMTYSSYAGEVIHDPGPITVQMLWEMGWVHTFIRHDTLSDRESLADPFTVAAEIYSDTAVLTGSRYLYYSFDGFGKSDSLPMNPTANPDEYAANIPVEDYGINVSYYIQAVDTFERVYTSPAQAPSNSYSFYVGTDTIPPKIDHIPLSFVLESSDSVEIRARIWDNLGIDTAEIQYKINGVEQEPIDLDPDTLNEYSGYFVFSEGQITAGDVIRYRIRAVDASAAMHAAYAPDTGYYAISVEDVPPYVDEYENDFETGADDFLMDGFSHSKPSGFSSYALHSDHPYPSPNKDNTNYEFTAQLKIPIRLRPGDAYMQFNEIAFIEPGDPGTVWGDDNFWDYVIIEASLDGTTWFEVNEGYDCRAHQEWEDAYGPSYTWVNNQSTAVPDESDARPRLVNLLSNPVFKDGDIVFIRFRLFSDWYANGWGWMIDDLKIQGPVSTVEEYPIFEETVKIYPNPSAGTVKINLQMREDVEKLQVTLTDLFGKQILREQYIRPGSSFTRYYQLDDLPSGIYLMRIESGYQNVIRKIVITR